MKNNNFLKQIFIASKKLIKTLINSHFLNLKYFLPKYNILFSNKNIDIKQLKFVIYKKIMINLKKL